MFKHGVFLSKKSTFFRKLLSSITIVTLLFNSLMPYGLAVKVYAQEEASESADVFPTPKPSSQPTATPSATPTPIESEPPTPQPSFSPEASSSATPTPEPIATESAKVEQTPQPSASQSANAKRSTDKEAGVSRDKYVSNQIIVKYKKSKLSIQSITGKVKSYVFQNKHNLKKQDEVKDLNIEVYTIDKPVLEKIEELKKDSDVEYAEPNYLRYPQYTPNDPSFNKLWGLNNTGQDINGYGLKGKVDADIDAPEAWDLESADQQDTIVAVLDTGVAYNHVDLHDNMWSGLNCKDENNNLIAGGCPNHGWDFENNDNNPGDYYGHGSHVSGTIAGVANNSTGIAGVSSKNNTKIMALRIGFNNFTIAGEIKAISFAKNNGAKVINASYGGGGYSQAEKDAIAAFPGLFIAAAGNNYSNNDSNPFYPASYDSPNMIVVAATNYNDGLASFSNYGANSVDIGAPGVSILSSVISPPVSIFENFDLLTPPNISSGYSKTGDWGTYSFGVDPYYGNNMVVLYGDVFNKPYKKNSDSTITSPQFDLAKKEQASFDFYTRCDTQKSPTGAYTDYMVLEVSSDGSNFTEIKRWDEIDLEALYTKLTRDEVAKVSPNGGYGYAGGYLNANVPLQYLTGNFKFRFRWITNSDADTGTYGDGCYIDNLNFMYSGSETNSDLYEFYQGTSMATPHVVGEAAMIYSYNPNLSDSQVKNIILNSGDPLSALAGKTLSGKRINLYNALLQANPQPSPSPTATPSATPTPTATPSASPSPTPIPNNPPVASDVAVTTSEDTAITFNMAVTDPENDYLHYNIVSWPVSGQLEVNVGVNSENPNGGGIISPTVIYTPNKDFNGQDEFTYNAHDEHGLYSNNAKATITVDPINDAPIGSSSAVLTNEDTAVEVALTASDVDNDNLTYAIVGNPAHGNLGTIKDNKVKYTPNNNYSGSDSFTFKAYDGKLYSNTATVSITVTPFNDPPVLNPIGNLSVNELTELTFKATANDSEGSPLTYSLLQAPEGAVINPATGVFSWIPSETQGPGSYTFTVLVSDESKSDSETITVTVKEVNTAPVAKDGVVSTNEDTLVGFTLLAEDLDIPANSLVYYVVSEPLHGSLTAYGEKAYYLPNANFNGTDSFTFKANDGNLDSNTATVNITINPVNDAPVANSQSITTDEDTPITTVLSGSDIDGNTLTYMLVSNPTHGMVVLNGNQATYTANVNYSGTDSFTFKASDGIANSNIGTVTVNISPVNDAPIANDQSVTTNEDVPVTITLSGADVDGDVLAYSIASGSAHGTLSTVSGNKVTYTPNKDFNGEDSFSFKVEESRDSTGFLDFIKSLLSGGSHPTALSNIATVTITVNPVNDAPVANSDSASVDEDNLLTIAKSTLLANDFDVDGDTLTITSVSNPSHGTVNISGDNIIFTPDSNFNGQASFDYTISDGNLTSTAKVNITINPVNDAPVANKQFSSVKKGSQVTITLTGSDIDGDTLNYSIVNNPSHGNLGSISGDQITYSPENDYTGLDLFTFKVNDGQLDSNAETVNVTILQDTQTSPDQGGNATITDSTPEVVVVSPTQGITVAVNGATTSASINYSSLIAGGTGVIPQTTINSDKADIAIPGSTTVTSADSSWDGVMIAPIVTTVTLPETSNETKILSEAIEVGFSGAKLSFNKGVRLLMPNQAGKRVGYSRSGEDFTEITSTCASDNQDMGDALGADSECKIDSGSDLVIWTKHFTKFATYTQTTNSNSGSSGSGSVLAPVDSTSAPTCNDAYAGGAPTLLSAIVSGDNQVTLTWSKATDPVTHYVISYGLEAGKPLYGNPNVGGKDTTTYTVSHLSGGTTYYFRVRAGNGCNGGEYSNELSATPKGFVLEGQAEGFKEGVLGTKEDEKKEVKTEKSGTEVKQSNAVKNIFLWYLPIALLAFVLLTSKLKHRKKV